MTTTEIIQLINTGVNLALLIIVFKLTRSWTVVETKVNTMWETSDKIIRIDLRVNQMWSVFSRRFGTRIETAEEFDTEH